MKRPIAYDSTYYRDVMRILRNAGTILPLLLVPIGLLNRNGLLDSRFYVSDTWYGLVALVFVGTAILQYFVTRYRPTPENYLWLSVIYHLLGVTFILTVTGFNSPVIVCWIALMLVVDTYFGTIAFWLSALTLIAVAIISLTVYPAMPPDILQTCLYTIFILSVGFTISRIRIITDKERHALTKSREDENFQRDRLLSLVNSMGDAVIATDEQGSIKVFNAATLNLLDTNVSLTNKKIDRILRLYDEDSKHVRALEQARARGVVFSRSDLAHRFNDGEQINLYI